jgi:hypothetical protein
MLSSGISAYYHGAQILSEDMYLASDIVGLSRQFTTNASQVLDAAAPVIRDYGNAQGAFELGVLEDYPNKAAAMKELLSRTSFAEAHPTGILELRVGAGEEMTVSKWRAGLSGVDAQLSIPPNGKVRLTFTYSFVLGEAIS